MQALPLLYKRFIALVLALLFSSVSTRVLAEHPFAGYGLKTLHQAVKIGAYQEREHAKPLITMVYQPNCPWCKRQSKALATLVERCADQISINIVGHKGSKQALKRELKHYPGLLSAYLADHAFLRAIGGVKASPTILFYNEKGQLVKKQRGFIETTKLFKAASILTQQQCEITAS